MISFGTPLGNKYLPYCEAMQWRACPLPGISGCVLLERPSFSYAGSIQACRLDNLIKVGPTELGEVRIV